MFALDDLLLTALVAGELYTTEWRSFRGVPYEDQYGARDAVVAARAPALIAARAARHAAHDVEYYLRFTTTFVEMAYSEREEPWKLWLPATTKTRVVPQHAVAVLREPTAGAMSAAELGFTPTDILAYTEVCDRIAQIHKHNPYWGDSTPVSRREVWWAAMLGLKKRAMERHLVRVQAAWIRRRAALAAWAAAAAAPAESS